MGDLRECENASTKHKGVGAIWRQGQVKRAVAIRNKFPFAESCFFCLILKNHAFLSDVVELCFFWVWFSRIVLCCLISQIHAFLSDLAESCFFVWFCRIVHFRLKLQKRVFVRFCRIVLLLSDFAKLCFFCLISQNHAFFGLIFKNCAFLSDFKESSYFGLILKNLPFFVWFRRIELLLSYFALSEEIWKLKHLNIEQSTI